VTRCYLAFAAFAAGLGLFSAQPIERCWGSWAAIGYAAAAVMTSVARHRERTTTAVDPIPNRVGQAMAAAALAIALACATIAPLAWQAWAGLPGGAGEGPLSVLVQAASRLLRHGTPYLPAAGLSHVLAYDPYEPLMTVFGLPAAAGLPGWAGDPRLWLTVAGSAGFFLAFAITGAGGRRALRDTAFALASPVISLQVTTGGTDVPVIALLCVSLALGSRRPAGAAVTTGMACALKATAWPAVLVIAAVLAASRTAALARRFALITLLTAMAAMAACAPAALRDPGSVLRNAVLFPLGLSRHRTPAASPLPGHLLATAGPAARSAGFALLAAAALAFAWWLAARPPRDGSAAAARLAVCLAAVFALAPASRWGYFAYPLALTGWRVLKGRDRTGAYSSERTVLTPSESWSASPGTTAPLASCPEFSPASVAAAAVAAWSADTSLTAPRDRGDRTTTGRPGRR